MKNTVQNITQLHFCVSDLMLYFSMDFSDVMFSIDTLKSLQGLEKLQELRLKDDLQELSNPVCLNSSYKADVINILPNLQCLDGT